MYTYAWNWKIQVKSHDEKLSCDLCSEGQYPAGCQRDSALQSLQAVKGNFETNGDLAGPP